MDYESAVGYINSFINFEKIPRYNYPTSFKLKRMEALLQELGNPHLGLKVLHIAGSKGKGSSCAILTYILKSAGYRIGLYTSPHLLEFRERIRVLDRYNACSKGLDLQGFEGAITKEEFANLIEEIKPIADKYREHKILGRLSFFELLTALAFLYFKEKKVDFVVLETGLGGRLDATNVAESIACGLTNISYEHTDKLGDTLESIAREKCGIIKSKHIVVTVPQEEEAMRVIRGVSKEKNASLYEIGKDIKYEIVESNMDRQVFNIKGPLFSYTNLELNLTGRFQVENASLSIALVNLIMTIDEGSIRNGLKDVVWPGRLQLLRTHPYYILVDGAHNAKSMQALIESIKEIFHYKKIISIFGISKDKDIEGVCREIETISDIVILTKSRCISRAAEPELLKHYFVRPLIRVSRSLEEAFDIAEGLVEKGDIILITGSLFLVGDAFDYLNKRESLFY